MGWVGHEARIWTGELHTEYLLGDLSKRRHLGDPGIDGRIILKCVFKKCDGGERLN